ncbi:TPM domain-containing protein [Longimicrobium sp.]|uniref:TPM domain-containing protein n=1 Tax=Longimicrobium sp. TaxID=2029185 RepID=UPI002CB5B4E2|nr:TPM domain-containing protein [Longimicrobium sp.]HSU16417.1 TPM domain-containing protein [Longimicrobium sp.]
MRIARRRGRTALAAAIAIAGVGLRAPAAAQGLQLPQPVGYVNDFANIITPAYRDSIDAVVQDVVQKSGGEIVVVTLPSLQGRSRDEVALQIGREWKIGQKGGPTDRNRNTGTVVLVSTQDREWKVETGTNTMTFIPAAEATRLGRELMVPELRAGNAGRGIYLLVSALAQAYAEHFGFQLSPVVATPAPQAERDPYAGQPSGESGATFWFTIALIVVFFVLSGMGGRRRGCGGGGCIPIFLPFPMGGGGRRGGGWGGGGWGGGGGFGGGGGGGFGGFGGGGGFSGGGGGGSW